MLHRANLSQHAAGKQWSRPHAAAIVRQYPGSTCGKCCTAAAAAIAVALFLEVLAEGSAS